MDASSDAEALARVDAADALHDAAAIVRELAAQLGSELVVYRCCEALQKYETARAAAALPDVLLLLLKALRSHANCDVVASVWRALAASLQNGANADSIIEHGALELALAAVCGTPTDAKKGKSSLAVFYHLAFPKHVARAVQLGGVEVRFHW